MKKLLFLFVLSICSVTEGISQSQFQQFLQRVNTATQADRPAIVDSFTVYARSKGIPFIEGDTANFIYRGNVSAVFLAGDMNGWTTNVALKRIAGTTFYYYSHEYEANARLDYKFVENGSNWILDPSNPHTCSGGFGPNSELAMPDYVQPWEIAYRPTVRHGSLIGRTVRSASVGANYTVQIYVPAGYDTSKSYPSVYFQDGGEYLSLASARNILDNLIDSNLIQPLIGVFVTPNNRNEEYAGGLRNSYRTFFATELVPLIDSLYRTRRDPAGRLVMGDSYGGNISALISYYYPGVFGNCGLHSGAFQNFNHEADSLWYHAPAGNTRFVSVWGTYEPLWDDMRAFRDKMTGAGHEFHALELPEGHSWGQWRATIDFILRNTFPPVPSSVRESGVEQPSNISLLRNYPNPFNPSTEISFSVPVRSYAVLNIYTALGQLVARIHDGIVEAGKEYRIQYDGSGLASGVYYAVLQYGEAVKTRKILLMR